MENQKIKLQIKKNEHGIIGCKIEKVNEKKKDDIMEVDGRPNADGKPNDIVMESKEIKNESQKANGWVEPPTDSESEEGSNESTTGSEADGSENEDQLLKGSDEEGKKKEGLKEKLAKKRKERQEKEEFKKMMAEMKKMKKEIDEEREKLNEEKKDLEEKKKEKRNEAEQQNQDQWMTNNRMRVDKNALPEGWQWFSEGQNWVDGIFGFLDNNEERLIGIEYNLIKENKLGRVKGIWNCIMVINNGRKIFLDGGMMDEKAKEFLEGGENAKCCGVVSRRGVYRLSRMGKVYGTKGENIFFFKWRPMSDSNIGFNVGDMPHFDCRGGRKIVD